MDRETLFGEIKKKQSFLCIGLDPAPERIPTHLKNEKDPVLAFNEAIIEATADLCVAYKPNLAFYEALGPGGWETLHNTMQHVPSEIFTIADAKRGDIGNTSRRYATAFFEQMDFDAITVAPYMGTDSVTPFLEFKNKWVILLALTSNIGSADFQHLLLSGGERHLYQEVLRKSTAWAGPDQLMYVVGATQADMLQEIRTIIPEHFLLVPGVGAQGGDLETVARLGMTRQCGLLVNSSRGILYASDGKDFAEAARREALKLREQMKTFLEKYLPS